MTKAETGTLGVFSTYLKKCLVDRQGHLSRVEDDMDKAFHLGRVMELKHQIRMAEWMGQRDKK